MEEPRLASIHQNIEGVKIKYLYQTSREPDIQIKCLVIGHPQNEIPIN